MCRVLLSLLGLQSSEESSRPTSVLPCRSGLSPSMRCTLSPASSQGFHSGLNPSGVLRKRGCELCREQSWGQGEVSCWGGQVWLLDQVCSSSRGWFCLVSDTIACRHLLTAAPASGFQKFLLNTSCTTYSPLISSFCLLPAEGSLLDPVLISSLL